MLVGWGNRMKANQGGPAQKGTFISLQVYKRVAILQKVCYRSGEKILQGQVILFGIRKNWHF